MNEECAEQAAAPAERSGSGESGQDIGTSTRPMSLRLLLLLGGTLTLGAGVALLLAADLGSDGYSTLVNGITLAAGIPFVVANTLVSIAFVLLAWLRGLRPGVGTVVQIGVVGVTVWLLLMVLPTYLAVRLGYGGLYACWTAATVYILVLGIGFVWRFRAGQWRAMSVIETPDGR